MSCWTGSILWPKLNFKPFRGIASVMDLEKSAHIQLSKFVCIFEHGFYWPDEKKGENGLRASKVADSRHTNRNLRTSQPTILVLESFAQTSTVLAAGTIRLSAETARKVPSQKRKIHGTSKQCRRLG